MKWVGLVLLLALVPVLAQFFRNNPSRAPLGWGLIGALPFLVGPWHLSVAPVSWALWPGYVHGIEITALDALAAAVLMSGYPKGGGRLPFLWPFLFYFAAASLAVFEASVPVAASFYLWQLARIYLLCVAAARICNDRRGAETLISGMIVGLAIQAGYATYARAGGALQTGGSLGHQNLLGFVSHMVIMPSFALVLAGRRKRIGAFGLAVGAIAVVLTASRATIGLSFVGLGITYLLSVVRRGTTRKATVGFAVAALVAVAFPFAQASLDRRFDFQAAVTAQTDYDERAAFEKAARMMIADHPLGVGPNMYVMDVNLGGYSDRAGVGSARGSRSANVHNSFLLVTAETGYPGVIAFVILLTSVIGTALVTAWRHRRDPRGELLIGIAGGLLAVGLHAFFEWAFMVDPSQYLYAISIGLVAGLQRQLGKGPEMVDRPPVVRKPLVGTLAIS